MFRGIRALGYAGYNTTITGLWWHGGVRKGRFQQSDTTHSGTGEKKTLNINVVGNIIKIGNIKNRNDTCTF